MLLAAWAQAGEPDWITMRTADFVVYSSASQRATRDMLAQLERVRGFFVHATRAAPVQSVPVAVIIFGTNKEYEPFRSRSFAAAYYTNDGYRDYIVVGEPDEQSAETASHEYTHLVIDHAGFSLPPWLNEGIAELFSTLHARHGETVFGTVIPGRLYALNENPWVPLQTILAADEDSPYYNDTTKAESLYNEGWALVHMLETSDQYHTKFWELVGAISNGTPSVQALEATYGVPITKLEDELREYVRRDRFHQLGVKIPLEDVDKLPSKPADPFEVRELEAELLTGMSGRREEARKRLEELKRDYPARPEPWAALGRLGMRHDDDETAAADFEKAFELGDHSSRLLLDIAEVNRDSKPERAAEALKMVIAQDPGNIDARLSLARLQIEQDKESEALATTQAITQVRTAQQRDNLLLLRARAYLRLGNTAAASSNAQELKRSTKVEWFRTQADDILRRASQP